MNLQILISTSNDGIFDVIKSLLEPRDHVGYVISHQIYNGKSYDIKFNRNDVIYQQSHSKGLSKNRNFALSLATADICLLSDDDVNYKQEWIENLFKAFKENPDSDIITLKIFSPKSNHSKSYKRYPASKFYHNIRTIFQVSSIEIAFRLSKIKERGLLFDENFGLSSRFNFGEENIFLGDALYSGLILKFIPVYVVSHPFKTPRKINTKENIITSGAIFYRIFKALAVLTDIFSVVYNYQDYKSITSPLKYLLLIIKGNHLGKKLKQPRGSILKIFLLLLSSIQSSRAIFQNFLR